MDDTLILSQNWKEFETREKSLSYFYDYVKYQAPLTNTTLKDHVFCLRSGECLHLDFQNQTIFTSFVEPDITEANKVREIEIRARFESLISQAESPKTAFHLSAGLDSSLLVLLAKRLWKDQPLCASTCKTLGRGTAQEMEFVERLCEDHDIDLQVFDLSEIDLFEAGKTSTMARVIRLPIHPTCCVI